MCLGMGIIFLSLDYFMLGYLISRFLLYSLGGICIALVSTRAAFSYVPLFSSGCDYLEPTTHQFCGEGICNFDQDRSVLVPSVVYSHFKFTVLRV